MMMPTFCVPVISRGRERDWCLCFAKLWKVAETKLAAPTMMGEALFNQRVDFWRKALPRPRQRAKERE